MTIHHSWNKLFKQYNFEFDENEEFYPPIELVFKVFEMDVKKIKICLIGQDCYHGKGQAHGFSFSVPDNVKIPPSLKNIFKELLRTFPERNYKFVSGNLSKWFYNENIFLLNCALTVKPKCPSSHIDIWKEFIDDVIKYICKYNSHCIFLLLGNFAKSKKSIITNRIIEGTHPSPLAVGSSIPFIGSNIFAKVEQELGQEINWQN